MAKGANEVIGRYMIYLSKKGIPSSFVEKMVNEIADTCLKESDALRAERVFTALALAIRRTYGFGAARIVRGMAAFSRILEETSDDKVTWPELMEILDRETGLIVRQGSTEERLGVEYIGRNAERMKAILEAEAKEEEAKEAKE